MPLVLEQLLKPVNKLRKLITKIDNDPAPDQVHDLRTKARRFEAMSEALSLHSHGLGKQTLKHLGRLRKGAGRVRDMDVLTTHASSIHLNGEEECEVQLLEYLGVKRHKRARKLYADLKRLRPVLRKGLKRAPAILTKLTQKNGEPAANPVSANARKTALAIAAQLAAPQRLDKTNLHPYRLKVKELQDILQLAGGSPGNKLVDDLGKVKDSIGDWHDWEELVSIAGKTLKHGTRCALMAELKLVASRKYKHAIALVQTLRKRHLLAAPHSKIAEARIRQRHPAV